MDMETAVQTIEALKRRMLVGGMDMPGTEQVAIGADGQLVRSAGEDHTASWNPLFVVNLTDQTAQEMEDFKLLKEFFGS